MPHFHDFNPWANTLIYLSDLEEFLEAMPDDDTKVYELDGSSFVASNRSRYRAQIEALKRYDLYVLKEGELGVRFGKEGNQYLSPYSLKEKARALFQKYSIKSYPFSIEQALREAAQAGINITVHYWPEPYWEADERWHCDLDFKIKLEEKGAGPEVIQAAWLKMKDLVAKAK